jgi:two-component system, OmpR family, sensor histidine kinase KdpD
MTRLSLKEYGWAIGIIGAATGIALALRPYLQTIDVAMLYLLAVVVIAYRHRRGPALMASVLSIAVFDYGFVPPFYTFNVHNTAFFLTFAVMLVVAMGMSQLTGRIREQAEEASEGEQLAAAQYTMSRELAGASGLQEQVAIASRHISHAGEGEAVMLLSDTTQSAETGWHGLEEVDSVAVRVAARMAYERGESAGRGTAHGADAEALVVPLKSSTLVLGIVIFYPQSCEDLLSPQRRRVIETLAEQAAVSFERAQLAERHEQARVEVESERLRTALLSSLSHDLRTPLGSIEGAASSLLQGSGLLSPEARQDMAETILEESRRMTRLIANLLDMVRVETGALMVRKEWQPLEEALGVALLRLDERLGGHPVETRLPDSLPLVPIDELLIEQVFINLLENAIRHTPPSTPINISAWPENGAVVVEVADEGAGVPEGEEETIFRKFHRSSSADRATPAGGSGLGLTICRGVITAHGGRIWLERSGGKGAAFRFTIPLDGPEPRPVSAEVSES